VISVEMATFDNVLMGKVGFAQCVGLLLAISYGLAHSYAMTSFNTTCHRQAKHPALSQPGRLWYQHTYIHAYARARVKALILSTP
jgi:hypothetical protein